MDTYLTPDRLVELSEFPAVQQKRPALRDYYVFRAHTIAASYGPFPPLSLPWDDSYERQEFISEMELAVFLVAERLILGNASVPAEAAGLTSEKIGSYEYSRAPGGGKSGTPHKVEAVPAEAELIFLRWRLEDPSEDPYRVERTDVFGATEIVDADDPGRKVFVREDIDTVAPGYLTQVTGRDY